MDIRFTTRFHKIVSYVMSSLCHAKKITGDGKFHTTTSKGTKNKIKVSPTFECWYKLSLKSQKLFKCTQKTIIFSFCLLGKFGKITYFCFCWWHSNGALLISLLMRFEFDFEATPIIYSDAITAIREEGSQWGQDSMIDLNVPMHPTSLHIY